MIPHTLVLKPGLVIHSIYNGYWFWGRPSVDDLWRDLRAATSEIRPDWDLSKPGSARPGTRVTGRASTDGTGGPLRSSRCQRDPLQGPLAAADEYWRVTFDHPPINAITATTVAALSC